MAEHTDVTCGRGRVHARTISALPAPPDLPYPHINQVFLMERQAINTAGQTLTHLGLLGTTSVKPEGANSAAIAALG